MPPYTIQSSVSPNISRILSALSSNTSPAPQRLSPVTHSGVPYRRQLSSRSYSRQHVHARHNAAEMHAIRGKYPWYIRDGTPPGDTIYRVPSMSDSNRGHNSKRAPLSLNSWLPEWNLTINHVDSPSWMEVMQNVDSKRATKYL